MIHSLVGQSEVLTLSGVYFLATGSEVAGSFMIAAGVLGGLCRFMVNFQLLSQMKNENLEENEDEKFTRILSEIAQKNK